MILNNSFEEPYNKFAPEGPVHIISKSIAKSRLTKKFSEITDLDVQTNYDKFNNLLGRKEIPTPSDKILKKVGINSKLNQIRYIISLHSHNIQHIYLFK